MTKKRAKRNYQRGRNYGRIQDWDKPKGSWNQPKKKRKRSGFWDFELKW